MPAEAPWLVILLVTLASAGSAKPIECAFKWAQSDDHIFVFAKYAHKLDAPAPNNVVAPTVDVTPSSVSITANNTDKIFTL